MTIHGSGWKDVELKVIDMHAIVHFRCRQCKYIAQVTVEDRVFYYCGCPWSKNGMLQVHPDNWCCGEWEDRDERKRVSETV